MHCYTVFYRYKIIYGLYKTGSLHPLILQYTADYTMKGGQTEGNMWSFTRRFTVFYNTVKLRQYFITSLPVAFAIGNHTFLDIHVHFKLVCLCLLSHKTKTVIDLL